MSSTKRDIQCPCGHYLGSSTNSTGGGTKHCSACKRRVKFTLTKNGVFTAYEK